MAIPDIPAGGQPRRLDSWKQIAEYLRRDVRTAMRWESQGLPLHRVGGTGRSVFAFTNEIDDWMAGRPADADGNTAPVETTTAPPPVLRTSRIRTITISVACALVVIAVGAVVMSSSPAALDLATLHVTETASHVSVADASGTSRVVHRFGPGATLREGPPSRVEDLDGDGVPEIVALVAFYETAAGRARTSGELLDLTLEGTVRWRFVPDVGMRFADGSVPGPWSMADWQAEPSASPKRVAVAAHDVTWWASVVALLDHNGQRLGYFTNPGWIESVMWQSADRLAVAGFNNQKESAMFAMLDATRLEGQAPGTAGTIYPCVSCSTAAPVFYATFPRSEVNLVTASRFNRARLSTSGDRIVVTTVEMSRDGGDVTAFYEFDRNLTLVQARYSDIYWSEHKRLELEGRLKHSREQCPDRDGPPAIEIWDAARGWVRTTAMAVPRP